ncbi:MAG: hypothetical protein Q8N18_18500 [Opitutaceae bacterium]|nr:hypothetical protein [Opitutaceae bacterium]
MLQLQEANGQQAPLSRLLEQQRSHQKEVVLVTGPHGSGVSWTLVQAGIAWEDGGGVALLARGAALATQRKFFPWLTLAAPGKDSLTRWDILKGGATRAAESVPVVGKVTGYLVGELINYRKKRLAQMSTVLDEKEQDLLFVIQTAAERKRLLLIADHVEDWDNESWTLLGLILSPHLHEFYPALKDVLVLIGARDEPNPRLRALIEKIPVTEFRIRSLERSHLPAALSTFGFPALTAAESDSLFVATAGRLDLLHDFGAHLLKSGPECQDRLGTDLYAQMIGRRLLSVKTGLRELEELLGAASFLGVSFLLDDVRCLTGRDAADLLALFRQAEEERLLKATGEMGSFSSEALHRYFQATRSGDNIAYHAKFAECLRLMRPGDYQARWLHLLAADKMDEALACYALAAVESRRQQKPAPEPGKLTEATGWSDINQYLATMRAAYDHHDNDRLAESLALLETIEGFLPEVLVAERDYLEAQLRLKSHLVADFERAVAVLTPWQNLKDREPELWSRIAQNLIVAQTQTGDDEAALQLEEAITKHYWTRRKVDPWALYGLNCLRRRAECLHHFPAARNRLESALAYFGPRIPESLPRHPLQYYYTLTNLVANLVASGLFDAAIERAQELERVVQTHSMFPWPALEVAANNSVLAGYLEGSLPLAGAVELMQQINDGRTDVGDRILILNNLAVLLVHSGRTDQARESLETAWTKLGDEGNSDDYHRYFVGSNLAGLLALAGEKERSARLLSSVRPGLDGLSRSIRETLLRRHELMSGAFARGEELDPITFDSYLRDKHPPQLGPQWSFYGRGFLFTDIQFWSAD